MVVGSCERSLAPGDDHLMFDGLNTCDHTDAADSVKVYAMVTVCTTEGKNREKHETPNTGMGCGALASESACKPEEANNSKSNHKTAGCCVGDTAVTRVDLLHVNDESGRKVECLSD